MHSKNLKPDELASENPDNFKGFSEQVCLRCAKSPAVENEMFCYKCLLERQEFDEIQERKEKLKPN